MEKSNSLYLLNSKYQSLRAKISTIAAIVYAHSVKHFKIIFSTREFIKDTLVVILNFLRHSIPKFRAYFEKGETGSDGKVCNRGSVWVNEISVLEEYIRKCLKMYLVEGLELLFGLFVTKSYISLNISSQST